MALTPSPAPRDFWDETDLDTGWKDKAACKGQTHLFFNPHVCDQRCDGPKGCTAGRQEEGRYERIQKAKALCETCPVTDECLDYALVTEIKFGFWGGLTERQRRELRAQRREGRS